MYDFSRLQFVSPETRRKDSHKRIQKMHAQVESPRGHVWVLFVSLKLSW